MNFEQVSWLVWETVIKLVAAALIFVIKALARFSDEFKIYIVYGEFFIVAAMIKRSVNFRG